MKVHDLIFIDHKKYMDVVGESGLTLTSDLDIIMGIKYYCSEYDPLDKNKKPVYVFEVIDPKKLILFKLKYEL